MTQVNYSNAFSTESVQTRRLCLTTVSAIFAVITLTPILTKIFGASPRKASITALRFSFLIVAAVTWRRSGPGLASEAGLRIAGNPLRTWFRGFLMGSIPLASYVVFLTIMDERVFEGIQNQGKFWWAVTKYMPLALIIGFLEDMLFFGFLATLLGRRYSLAVVIYAVSHFLAPSKQFHWQSPEWLVGWEALGAMGESLAAATSRPVEIFGLVLVGGTLALLCRQTNNIWLAMGVHGGWYYVRTISRKLGEDLEGNHEWLFGTDRFYDGLLGWVAILTTGVLFWFSSRPEGREQEQASGDDDKDRQQDDH
ncbi:MAG: membrane protease YdiL (CAAX protease family) [Planctomycetota bacterium]|jgi:membrane protease YdiL (CAAX protease family)